MWSWELKISSPLLPTNEGHCSRSNLISSVTNASRTCSQKYMWFVAFPESKVSFVASNVSYGCKVRCKDVWKSMLMSLNAHWNSLQCQCFLFARIQGSFVDLLVKNHLLTIVSMVSLFFAFLYPLTPKWLQMRRSCFAENLSHVTPFTPTTKPSLNQLYRDIQNQCSIELIKELVKITSQELSCTKCRYESRAPSQGWLAPFVAWRAIEQVLLNVLAVARYLLIAQQLQKFC